MADQNAEVTKENAIKAAVETYLQIDTLLGLNSHQKTAARSAVRNLMVRLGVYSDFVAAVSDQGSR